ncbi:SF3 helicase domain-containing protein, partial [Nephila pilipes]
MAKNKYISFILFLILIVTLVNLFYKPWLRNVQPTIPHLLKGSWVSSITRSTCPLYGFKCPTDEPCDCAQMCSNGDFVPFRVLPKDPIFLMDQNLMPGTYCLPRGIGNCNQKTSYHVFSLAGWTCIPRNQTLYQDQTLIACHHEEAADNTKNILWDHLLQQPASEVENAYETLADGKTLRYQCQCNSLDILGKPMMSVVPFVCSVDYCIKDILNPLPIMGYENAKCECGPNAHLDPDDDTSPCVVERSRIENNTFIGAVECMTNLSWKKSPIFCPHDEGMLNFSTLESRDMSAYLHRVNTVEEAPATDAYLLYNIRGGIYYIKRSDFSSFSHYWCRQERFASITMDLATCEHHSLTLDLDFSSDADSEGQPYGSILPLIESTLKLNFLPHVKHFTYIIAARHGGRGLHIHLPEFAIGHDDYILFCHHLSVPLQYMVDGKGVYKLDILQNMMLAGSGKPDTFAYRAMQMIYVDEKETYSIDFRDVPLSMQLNRLKKSFKRVKHNTDSYFRKFLFLDVQQANQHLLRFMMPVVTSFPPLYKLSYSTLISNTPSESCDVEDVATFTYKRTHDVGYI